MAILHTPRTLASIARGLIKKGRGLIPSPSENFHVYKCRPNPFWDIDYIGHMNNAAYLQHCEFARWEWTAESGALEAMYKDGMHFIVNGSAIRYRREISLRDKFEIHSSFKDIDDRHMYASQTFRSSNNGEGEGRILAQFLMQAVAVKNRKVIHPRNVLEAIGLPEDVIESLVCKTIIPQKNLKTMRFPPGNYTRQWTRPCKRRLPLMNVSCFVNSNSSELVFPPSLAGI
mmetsp:Transcript_26707/g.39500  ORF Transcript_26707/g.39500 Transcript_26707/m.39500 type:complete len:230 (+) Transcript_26707:1529-2218(+)